MIPSLEGWPTKAKEAPFPHEVRLAPLDTNPVVQCLGDNTFVYPLSFSTETKLLFLCGYLFLYVFLVSFLMLSCCIYLKTCKTVLYKKKRLLVLIFCCFCKVGYCVQKVLKSLNLKSFIIQYDCCFGILGNLFGPKSEIHIEDVSQKLQSILPLEDFCLQSV